MKSRHSALGIPALVLAGLLFVQLPSLAQRPNAWRITDNSADSGSTLGYTTQLNPSQTAAATNAGFRFTVNARFVTDFGDSATMNMSYGLGARRFLIWWDLDSNTNLTAELDGGPTFTLTTNGTGAGFYHTHEIIYDTNSGRASYVFDGVVKTNNWQSSANASAAGRIAWGAGSSGGQGRMNFNSVNFSITGLGTVASYDADSSGIAPDPATNGWTLVPASPPAGTAVTGISPDNGLLLAAETFGSDSFTNTSARVKGLAFSTGSSILAWFEWGTDTNYGNVTPVQDLGFVQGSKVFQTTLAGLVGGPDYHYRAVVSNSFGVQFGADDMFNLRFFRDFALPERSLNSADARNTRFRVYTTVGDFDNDGLLDLLLTGIAKPPSDGAPLSELWRNLGGGRFTNVTDQVAPGLTAVEGPAAWGDFDNDGHLDLLLAGITSTGAVCQLWRNTAGGFTNVPIPGLPGIGTEDQLDFTSLSWVDFDSDGRLDFMITGTTNGISSETIAQLWRNTGSGFTNVPLPGLPLPPLFIYGRTAWGDFDNDGRSDFLMTAGIGAPLTPDAPVLWRNTATGFTNVPIPGLPKTGRSSAAWGDFDNDGRLDFLIEGARGNNLYAELWRNTGAGFTNVPIPELTGFQRGKVTWGDYDNDGRLDFLITGITNSDEMSASQLWRNTGNGFTNTAILRQPGVTTINYSGPIGFETGSAVLADLDNDGRLDILLSGKSDEASFSDLTGYVFGPRLLLSNMAVASNQPPAAPTGLSATVSGTRVALHWNAPSDDSTPPDGLSYNVRIGTTPGARDMVSPPALPDGVLLVPQMGAVRNGSSTFYELPPGRTYYWSVQAVDTSFAGSPFATEQQFSTPPALFGPVLLGNGQFQFSFTNLSSTTYEVLGSANLALPVGQWEVLGLPASLGGGLFRFTDMLAPNHAQRFYLLRAH